MQTAYAGTSDSIQFMHGAVYISVLLSFLCSRCFMYVSADQQVNRPLNCSNSRIRTSAIIVVSLLCMLPYYNCEMSRSSSPSGAANAAATSPASDLITPKISAKFHDKNDYPVQVVVTKQYLRRQKLLTNEIDPVPDPMIPEYQDKPDKALDYLDGFS